MSRFLIVCSSTDGQTGRICARLREIVQAQGHQATLVMIEQAQQVDPLAFERIVIGARIRYGRHDRRVHEFVARHRRALLALPNAFFSVNIVARKPQKAGPETNPYVVKFLKQTAWRPDLVGVFAGKLDYPRYGALDRWMIRFIMLLTDGPTRADTVQEFTDWQQVQAFGLKLAALDRPAAPACQQR